MKKSFYTTIVAMALLMAAGIASADSVDIGLGQMDRAEFESLRQIMSGEHRSSVAVKKDKPADIYVGELNWKDVEAIRHSMAFGGSGRSETAVASSGQVNIGLGAMPTTEFCDLNKLVASNNVNSTQGFGFVCP